MPGKPRTLKKGQDPFTYQATGSPGSPTITIQPGETIPFEHFDALSDEEQKGFDTADAAPTKTKKED